MRLSGGLGALIYGLAQRAGARPVVEEIRSTPWASITFTGARHRLAIRFDGDKASRHAAAMTDGLSYAEFNLGMHVLVDIDTVENRSEGDSVRLTIEALTVEAD